LLTPQEFVNKWDTELSGLVDYHKKDIDSFSFSQATKDFLLHAGLPESASPFLTFESSANGGGIRLPEKDKDAHVLRNFIYVGFTGSGSPICIDEENDHVVYLDHEKAYERIFINSSVAQFAESLLIYREFVTKIKALQGRRAFLERNANPESIEWLIDQLKRIDADSLTEGSFWKEEPDLFQKS
jgi:hypothetical protein